MTESFERFSIDCAADIPTDLDAMNEGMEDARLGIGYPGSHRSTAYRFGYECEMVAARRVPIPDWMIKLGAELLATNNPEFLNALRRLQDELELPRREQGAATGQRSIS